MLFDGRRILLFWGITAASLYALSLVAPYSNWPLILSVVGEVASGNVDNVSKQSFAFALASLIVQFAGALALAFLFAHVIVLRVSLRSVRRIVERSADSRAFAADFDAARDRIGRNWLIGDAYGEFAETTVMSDGVVQNTIRPQTFINFGEARERLFGLKMMSAIPGYFVGLGLLLTFIGLVIALYKASEATGANGSSQQMTTALNDLLQAATFKFSTSIAGLGASLALSMLFRSYQIWIERGFYRFCHALEKRMSFHPSQRLAKESRDILAEQRDELKTINSERFFDRFGQAIIPGLQTAIGPLADSLQQSLNRVEQSSQGRLEEMLRQFLESLNKGAGAELNGVAEGLVGARDGLEQIRSMLDSSGMSFAGQLAQVSAALQGAAGQAEQAAMAFGNVSSDFARATAPLLEHGERVAEATKIMADAVGNSVAALERSGTASQGLAESLTSHFQQIEAAWQAYEQRFSRVDEDLGAAADRFHAEVTRHQEAIRDFVIDVDEHNSRIVASLVNGSNGFAGNVEDLTETVEELRAVLEQTSARLASGATAATGAGS